MRKPNAGYFEGSQQQPRTARSPNSRQGGECSACTARHSNGIVGRVRGHQAVAFRRTVCPRSPKPARASRVHGPVGGEKGTRQVMALLLNQCTFFPAMSLR